jgi:putative addiction module killer protein
VQIAGIHTIFAFGINASGDFGGHRGTNIYHAAVLPDVAGRAGLQRQLLCLAGCAQQRDANLAQVRAAESARAKRAREATVFAERYSGPLCSRVRRSQRGDCKPGGSDVVELRIHSGPGYRVYCWKDGFTVIVAMGGGDKSSQERDIAKAQHMVTLLKE